MYKFKSSDAEEATGVSQGTEAEENSREMGAAPASLGAVAALLPPMLLVLGPTRALTVALAVLQGACLLALLRLR